MRNIARLAAAIAATAAAIAGAAIHGHARRATYESVGLYWKIAAQGMVYHEPETAWKLLGPWEYGTWSGVLP